MFFPSSVSPEHTHGPNGCHQEADDATDECSSKDKFEMKHASTSDLSHHSPYLSD